MLTESQFETARISYLIIGVVLLGAGIFMLKSDIVSVQVYGPLLIAIAGFLFHDVRIARIERKIRTDESETE